MGVAVARFGTKLPLLRVAVVASQIWAQSPQNLVEYRGGPMCDGPIGHHRSEIQVLGWRRRWLLAHLSMKQRMISGWWPHRLGGTRAYAPPPQAAGPYGEADGIPMRTKETQTEQERLGQSL